MVFRSSRDFLIEHVAVVRATVVVKSAPDRRNITVLERELNAAAKRHKTLSIARIVCFALIYASVLAQLPLVGKVLGELSAITGFFGVGVFSLLALYLTYRISILWNEMVVVYGHTIAIYEKHNRSEYPVGKSGAFALLKKS